MLELFKADRDRARQAQDPTANVCQVATVNSDGWPELRTLVLRDVVLAERNSATGAVTDDPGESLALFINSSSPKWAQAAANQGRLGVHTYWPSINVQYRLQAFAEALPEQIVRDSWQLRPEPPKRMDWFYAQHPQSTPIGDRDALLSKLANLAPPEPLIAPESARGWGLRVVQIERLDLGQSNGVHDRTLARLQDGAWHTETLVP